MLMFWCTSPSPPQGMLGVLVMLSTSSRNMILKGEPTDFNLLKFLISFLTVSIPLASDAFNSNKFCLQYSPKMVLASARAVVVLPTQQGR